MLTFNHMPYVRIRSAKCRIDAVNPPGRYYDYNFEDLNIPEFIDVVGLEEGCNDTIDEYVYADEEMRFNTIFDESAGTAELNPAPDEDYYDDISEPDADFDGDYSDDTTEPDADLDEDYSDDTTEPDADLDEDCSDDTTEPDADLDEDCSDDISEPDAEFDGDCSDDTTEPDTDDADYSDNADFDLDHTGSDLYADIADAPINILNLVPTLYWDYPYLRPEHETI